jgi:hypothetical protein
MSSIRKGDSHPFITPACLAGDKAWKRWLLWKSKYDKVIETRSSTAVANTLNTHNEQKIKKDLWKTKQFFLAWFDRLDANDIKQSLNDKNLFHWSSAGSVCGYYLAISPIVKEWLSKNPINLMKEFGIDMTMYENCGTPSVIEYFKKEFSHEM